MAILWCGGEDIDFPNGSAATSSGLSYRSGYARSSLVSPASGSARSLAFEGGAITSGWLTFVCAASNSTSKLLAGFGLAGGTKGLLLATSAASGTRVALVKYDGTTSTVLATESGNSLATQIKLDLQVQNYGASATVTVYAAGTSIITYSGDVTVSGMSNMDCVGIWSSGGINMYYSEFIVADEDTRTFSLVTLAPSAAGTTDQWTGAYTDVDETAKSDADLVYTNTATQDEQFNLTNLPSGLVSIKAVRVAARASSSAGATATKVGLGINSGGTVDSGTLQATTTTWATVERLMTTNPVTGVDFTQSEIDALQINLRSGS